LPLLQHGMPAIDDFQMFGLIAVRELWPAITTVLRHEGQPCEHIHFSQSERCLTNPAGFRGDSCAQFAKKPALDFDDFLLRVQNFGFVLFQLRSGETFGVDQRLLAFVVGGSVVEVGLADFNVIAKNAVELDFQRADAGALAFALLNLRDILLAVAAEVAKLIQLCIDVRLDYASIRQRERWLRDNGSLDALAQIGKFIKQGMKFLQPRRCAVFDQPSQGVANERSAIEAGTERKHVARVRRFKRNAAEQALNIKHPFQRATQLFAGDQVFYTSLNCVEALIDLWHADRGPQHPRPQQTLAHWREGSVDCPKERDFWSCVGEERLHQLKVAHRDRIEH